MLYRMKKTKSPIADSVQAAEYLPCDFYIEQNNVYLTFYHYSIYAKKQKG